MKTCLTCERILDILEFYHVKSSDQEFQVSCLKCRQQGMDAKSHTNYDEEEY